MKQINDILKEVEDYYSNKVREHGASAKGVDWNSEASQELRFLQLLKVVKADEPFSMLDFGCGYGALLDFMKDKIPDFEYLGFDISNEMLARAEERNPSNKHITWTSLLSSEICDYTVASGIFNVKLKQEELLWKEYVEGVLIEMDKRSKKGFSFNMLTLYSDKEYMREYLYYADPMYYFDFCKRNFSKYVALLHDYPLYEFTIIVKK